MKITEIPNSPESTICSKCGKPLSLETAIEREEREENNRKQLEEEIKDLKKRQGKLESDNRGYGDLKSIVDEYLKEYFEDVFDKIEYVKNKPQKNSITS